MTLVFNTILMTLRVLYAVCCRRTKHARHYVTHQPYPRNPGRKKERSKRLEQKALAERRLKASNNPLKSMRVDSFAKSATTVNTPLSASSPSSLLNQAIPPRSWLDRARSSVADFNLGIILLRYQWPTARPFQREHGYAMAQRFPFFLLLVGLVMYDETAPFQFIRIQGPSMLPTMAADGSDIWFSLRAFWCAGNWRRGDIVGFSNPKDNPQRISCKRIIGLPGDRVPRYGQYVHLFTQQDPTHWGITPLPRHTPGAYDWVRDDWDPLEKEQQHQRNPNRQLIVPGGHVWLEADCPGFGIDSRHFGPIPLDWIRGKVVARVWPLGPLRHKIRPHPIPLDRETLMEHNLFRV
jgi:signal peptidase I